MSMRLPSADELEQLEDIGKHHAWLRYNERLTLKFRIALGV